MPLDTDRKPPKAIIHLAWQPSQAKPCIRPWLKSASPSFRGKGVSAFGPFCMAFPKHYFLGVRFRLARQHLREVRKELKRLVSPKHGEDRRVVARRAKAGLRALGLAGSRFSVPSTKSLGAEAGGLRLENNGLVFAPQPAPGSPIISAIGEEVADQFLEGTTLICSNAAIGDNLKGPPRSNDPLSSGPHEGACHKGEAQSKRAAGLTVGAMPLIPEAPSTLFPYPFAPWIFHNENASHFRAKKPLGEGTFGTVYGGSFGPHNEAVALKLLKRDPLQLEPDKDANHEIMALKTLAHPCIVRLYGAVFTTFNVQLFLQPHAMTLHKYVGQIPPPVEAKAKRIAQCVLRGLAYMHAAGWVHRDLKPGNILVDLQPLAAVICDLGGALLGEHARGRVTTLCVRAPEIVLRRPYGKASDVWSLGCTLAAVEHLSFLDLVLGKGPGEVLTRRAIEFRFMRGLVLKLCPLGAGPLKSFECTHGDSPFRLMLEVLKLGPLEAGVVGARFHSPQFHPFMAQMLHFQPQARATAEDLLKQPWLQP